MIVCVVLGRANRVGLHLLDRHKGDQPSQLEERQICILEWPVTLFTGLTYLLLIAQEDGGNDGRLQGVVESGHQVIHAVVVPEASQVTQHELNLAVADEHEHKAANSKEPKQEAD